MLTNLPKIFDKHRICIICEGNEEYAYLSRLNDLKVWNEQYGFSFINAGGNGNIPARYQDRYQNGSDELVLVFCDTEKKPHEQYQDIKHKINDFHGMSYAANEVVIQRKSRSNSTSYGSCYGRKLYRNETTCDGAQRR